MVPKFEANYKNEDKNEEEQIVGEKKGTRLTYSSLFKVFIDKNKIQCICWFYSFSSDFSYFQYPSIMLPCLDSFVSVSGTGISDSVLEPYLKIKMDATQMDVTVCFLLLGAFFVIMNPIAGWVNAFVI